LAKKPHPAIGLAVAICDLAVRLLPLRWASELMALVMRLGIGLHTSKAKVRRNLSEAFPELDDAALDRLVRQVIASLGRLLAETLKIRAFMTGTEGAVLTVKGAVDYPLVRQGQAIYVSAHLGNWELMPILFRQHGIPLTIIYRLLRYPSVDAKLMRARQQTGQTYVERTDAMRGCVAALKRGESVALLIDQKTDTGIEVEFFGRPALITHFPARMALKFGCPIIVGEAIRVAPGHVEVTYHEPIFPPATRGPEAEREMTQAMARTIESTIRAHPEQWFCFQRRFKPPKAAPAVEGQAVSAPAE
jgi:KDO2-lipid IV(A) lauroyltransferase